MLCNEEDWLKFAKAAEERWQFPNAYATADRENISVYHPKASGSTFYNYKGFYNIVLLSVVECDFKFLLVDFGCQGRISEYAKILDAKAVFFEALRCQHCYPVAS